MKNIIVVGTGFSGTIIARKLAEEIGVKVKVVEKRSHIGGNMYDEMDEHGIRIQKYGPHVLVTNEWSIIEYLSNFTSFYKYNVKELSIIDDKYIRLPFNFESVQQMLGCKKAEIVINKLRKEFSGKDRVPVMELCNSKDKDISEYGNLLFEKSFKTYCAKQWDLPPEKLDISIMGRSAFALNYDERYMNKDFQYLPKNGFKELFENMLNHQNIELQLNENALEHIRLVDEEVYYDNEKVDLLVFTGPLDALFGYCYGELPYRSLDIKYQWENSDRLYPEAIISCPQAKGYTRKTEYKFLMEDCSKAVGSVIATEYPCAYNRTIGNEPFYPVVTEETIEKYDKYKKLADKYKNLYLCGRLAEFRYYNMDDCIINAINIYENIKNKKVL